MASVTIHGIDGELWQAFRLIIDKNKGNKKLERWKRSISGFMSHKAEVFVNKSKNTKRK